MSATEIFNDRARGFIVAYAHSHCDLGSHRNRFYYRIASIKGV